jgi:chromate transport protein ChrA
MRGTVSILLGLVFLTKRESIEIFAVMVGMWALLAGVLRTAAAALFRRMVEARWLWILGVGSMLAGLVLLFLPPSALLLADVTAGYLCFHGAGELFEGDAAGITDWSPRPRQRLLERSARKPDALFPRPTQSLRDSPAFSGPRPSARRSQRGRAWTS